MSPKRWSVFRCFFEEPLTGQGTGFRAQDTVGDEDQGARYWLPADAFWLQHFFYRHNVPNGTRVQTTGFRSEIGSRKSELRSSV